MRKQHLFKITAILLTLCICISLLPASAIALEAEDTAPDTAINLSDVFAGFVDPAELYAPLDEDTVPDIIGYDDAVSRNHIQRLYTDEGNDLYKIVFLNIDGTKTMYTFDFPVKFVDKNGDIQDITLEIADSNMEQAKYETASNSAVTTFSARLSDGISLSGNGTDIKLVPMLPSAVSGLSTTSVDKTAESDVLQVAQRIDENTVEYPYDNFTTIEYSLTYTGFKEDIVVSEYTGQTEYEFTLYTNGYGLTEIDGSYYLVDDVGKIKASIGDIIIFTADNRNNTFGQIIPTTIVEKQEYLLTIVVDESFLSDKNTVYPIRIDPTVEINYDNNGSGAIEDITISSQASSSGSSGSLYIGLRQSQGISRVLMKFPGLNLNSLGSDVEIQTATVTLRDLMCESTALSIDCHVFAGNSWSEDNATWSNVSPNSYSTLLDSLTMSYSKGATLSPVHRYSFDITRAVQGWIDGYYTKSKGIIFKVSSSVENGSTYNYRTLGSYNRSSYKPTLAITYTTGNAGSLADGTYYLNNRYTGQYIKYNTSAKPNATSGLLASLGDSIHWHLQYVSGGYVIRSAIDPTIHLGVPADPSSTEVTLIHVDETEIPLRCKWGLSLASGGGGLLYSQYNSRYLRAVGSNISTYADYGVVNTNYYDSFVWRIASITKYGNTSAYQSRELLSFTVQDLIINKGYTQTPVTSVNPSNTGWAKVTDFNFYRVSGSSGVVDINSRTNTFSGSSLGIAQYGAQHKVTGRTYIFNVYVDWFTYILVSLYEFNQDEALLIRNVYDRVNGAYSHESVTKRAWRASRLLGGVIYDEEALWNQVAGNYGEKIEDDFTGTLGYTSEQFTTLCEAIDSNYDNRATPDFAHMQISLASRLAYHLGLDAQLVSVAWGGASEETVSYLTGWLGDVTLDDGSGIVIGNDDYCADLDAENVYRLITQNNDIISAINTYYASLSVSNTRAMIFIGHISFDTIKEEIYYELIDRNLWKLYSNAPNTTLMNYYYELICDEQYHWDSIRQYYPATYDFMCSVRDGKSAITDYE